MSYSHVGATVTENGNIVRFVFDGSGSLTLDQPAQAKILVIGGGGAGGTFGGGGGGGGGAVENERELAAGTYIVTVGDGGVPTGYRSSGAAGEASALAFGGTNIVEATGGIGGNTVQGSNGHGGASGAGYINGVPVNPSNPGYAGSSGGGGGAGGAGPGLNGAPGIELMLFPDYFDGYAGGGGGGSINSSSGSRPGGLGGGGTGSQGAGYLTPGVDGQGGGGGGTWHSGGYDDTKGGRGVVIVEVEILSGSYGEITGTLEVADVPSERDLVAISFAKQSVSEGAGVVEKRIVVGETRSAPDGTYTLQTPGFLDEVIILALADYGEVWRPNLDVEVGQRLRPTIGNETGHAYQITVAGNTGENEPTWWVPAGGSDLGSIGTATAQAVPAWPSVAHAPILPVPVTPGG